MILRAPHVEFDNVNSIVCAVTSVLLVSAAVYALVKLGEYVVSQISTLF
jgi:hypothetical protein